MAFRTILLSGPIACLSVDVVPVTSPPPYFDELATIGFAKYATVFGVPLLAHINVPTDKLRHAAHVSMLLSSPRYNVR
jgi:hypothetical protein